MGQVVEDFSAIIGDAHEGKAALHANHMEMVRYRSAEDPNYQLVMGVLRRWVRLASEGFDQNVGSVAGPSTV